ncbi:MAG: TonB family protein [Polyangiales bacterium]|jgi:TonB family protein
MVFGLAVLASLSVHLPVWGVLGQLAKSLAWDEPVVASVEEPTFVEMEPIAIEEELPETDSVEPEQEREASRERTENESEQDEASSAPVAPEAEPEPEPEPEIRTRPPVALERNPIPVQQHSQDPTVAPPEETQFIARENNRVDEETQAEVTNMVEDSQEELSVGAQLDPSTEDELGNSAEEEFRETENEEGPDDQMPALEPDEVQETQAAPERMGERARLVQEQNAQEGGEPDTELITINDGMGTFVIRRPRQRGTGGGERGGDSVQGREGQNGDRRGRGGDAERQGPNLRIGWRQFEGIFGEEQLRQERDEYAQSRLTRQRGSGRREREWTEFRAAIENFVPGVRSGNQTALNARASPFAEYLAALHRRIHISFHQFVDNLSPSGPMGDLSLAVKLEIVFAADGGIARIGVVNSSGVLPYDFGAFNAVKRATPFPAPPDAIKSGDGQVYVHWTFMRNEPFCHGENARPFILENAPAPSAQDALGGLQMDSVVPSGALPDYADGRGGSGDDGNGPTAPGEESTPAPRRPRIPRAPRGPRAEPR